MKLAAILGAAAALSAMPAVAEVPANLKPKSISTAWNVQDLEAQKAWYIDKLGMKVIRTYDRQGKVFEYIMGYEGNGAVLALMASPQRPKGPNPMGRLILQTPDSKGLAEHLKTQGIESRMVAAGAYFINDPEGNPIELYTPPPGR